ncbi:chitinase-3-like protein 1 [Elysia marginata]|uniref:Chitinase-3-like protein 1 n=1 Tax=Elysia marginata TaxID=1093978 RepID=A0AAV4IV03_9GAST|nr:chitinase-3-like protein 1 [Elysia marginata]
MKNIIAVVTLVLGAINFNLHLGNSLLAPQSASANQSAAVSVGTSQGAGGTNRIGTLSNYSSKVGNYTQPPPRLDRVVCNYDISAENRTGAAKFKIENLNVHHCTDLYYDYARLDSFPVEVDVPSLFSHWNFRSFEPTPSYSTLNDHKLAKPNLETFVIVSESGEKTHAPRKAPIVNKGVLKEAERPGLSPGLTFKDLVEHEDQLLTFSNWVVYLLRLWGFDGLAVRWPADVGPELLHTLLRTLRSRFRHDLKPSKRGGVRQSETLKLAVLLDTNKGDWLRVYDMQAISKLVDQITLEAVDGRQSYNRTLETIIRQPLYYKNGGNTPPGSITQPVDPHERLTIEEAVKLVVAAGVTRRKVNLAISLVIASGDRWISFEDAESIGQKIEYLKSQRIGGVALFSQSEDDFSGAFCGLGKFPLSSTAFLEGDIQVNKLLLLPWQRYLSGQTRLVLAQAWCFVATCTVFVTTIVLTDQGV